jgi:hypothetical protein
MRKHQLMQSRNGWLKKMKMAAASYIWRGMKTENVAIWRGAGVSGLWRRRPSTKAYQLKENP